MVADSKDGWGAGHKGRTPTPHASNSNNDGPRQQPDGVRHHVQTQMQRDNRRQRANRTHNMYPEDDPRSNSKPHHWAPNHQRHQL